MFNFRKSKTQYNNLFFTYCSCCDKKIIVDIPIEYKEYRIHKIHSCDQCISNNSGLRDNINESSFVDISDNLWARG